MAVVDLKTLNRGVLSDPSPGKMRRPVAKNTKAVLRRVDARRIRYDI